MTPPFPDAVVTRRSLLKVGGATVSMAALVAACGGDDAAAPGRVGNAPVESPAPDEEADDGTYLRTAASMELALVQLYARLTELGGLAGAQQALVDRMASDHEANAATANELATAAGASAFDCANQWYLDRYIGPALERVAGNADADIPESDDIARDSLRIASTFETTVAAMYQQMIEQVRSQELRVELAPLGALAARHAAAVAITVGEAPGSYVSPATSGGDVTPDESGFTPLYAIPTTFGAVSAQDMVIGARNDAGLRFTLPVDTPAANSYIFDNAVCAP
ncbi:MAG: hypothetical protein H0U21_02215 [Acidimicrobiia bacterium]|nr:hypothetical protein [Acidimicrobiia bacterium]